MTDRAALRDAAATPQRLQEILAHAVRAAAITCSRVGADPPCAHEVA